MSRLQTTNYADWRGNIVHGLEPADTDVEVFADTLPNGDEVLVMQMPLDSPQWQYMGVAPRPRTRWDWLVYDYHHGRIMRYPWAAVVRFSLNNWRTWNQPSSAWRRGETDEHECNT